MENITKKYQIIYADPAWKYEKTGGIKSARGMAKQHYQTTSMFELKKLPVNQIADNDCVLFMWATFPKLKEALELIEVWGFIYHNVAFNWIKKTSKGNDFFGMGYWTRANPEVCLLATKGKPKPQSHGVAQIVYAQIQKHSQKPNIIRDKIIELCGDLPRIELFARQKFKGWDSWGNELPEDTQNTLRNL